MIIGALILGATALGALGTVVCTGTKEKKIIETQKPTVNHNHYNISGNTIDNRVDNRVIVNNNRNIQGNNNHINPEDNNKEVITAIRELFREQEQHSQNDQALLQDIIANNEELARLIRK